MDDTSFTTSSNAPLAPHGSGMQKLNDRATRIFISLVGGLRVGDAKKVDKARGAFMAVSVDFLVGEKVQTASGAPWALYAVAQYYRADGDLVPYPDVEFYLSDDPAQPSSRAVYPIAIDHGPLGYHRYAELEGGGQISCVLPRGQADLARFCDHWMKNIAAQQRLQVR